MIAASSFGIIGYDIADNQIDTLTKAFQATTVACARCHDHKLDAISPTITMRCSASCAARGPCNTRSTAPK